MKKNDLIWKKKLFVCNKKGFNKKSLLLTPSPLAEKHRHFKTHTNLPFPPSVST